MLAQLNVKPKSLGLFLTKPTVIDKLISKNKSSILGISDEISSEDNDSDESTSIMGSETTTSDTDTSQQLLTKKTLHSTRMAPLRKHKKQVLGSKITSKLITNSAVQFKRKVGRPRKIEISRDISNDIADISKAMLKNKMCVVKPAKRGRPPGVKNGEPSKFKKPCKVKENVSDASKSSSQKNSPSKITKSKLSTSLQDSTPPKKLKQKTLSPKAVAPASSRALALLNTTKSSVSKKFPVLCGIGIRGRSQGSGRGIRGTRRAKGCGLQRGLGKGAPYLTRSDSPIPMLRNGKRRKCDEPSSLIDISSHSKKRKRLLSDMIKTEDFSDEQSSIVTESDFSYCESLSTPKDEDVNRELKTESNACDSDMCDVPDNNTDTNSNVFKSEMNETKVDIESNSNSLQKNSDCGKIDREKHLFKESIFRDSSDGSLDSDATEDSSFNIKNDIRKKFRRKVLEGVWVRRSTRSINLKEMDNDTVAIKELLDEKSDVKQIDSIKNDKDIDSQNLNTSPITEEKSPKSDPFTDFTLHLEESPHKYTPEDHSTHNIKLSDSVIEINKVNSKLDFAESKVTISNFNVDVNLEHNYTSNKCSPLSNELGLTKHEEHMLLELDTDKNIKAADSSVQKTIDNKRLSTTEIENLLTNEIISPIKDASILELHSNLSDSEIDSVQFCRNNLNETNEFEFTEILGTSISVSEFANIPQSTLDETMHSLEEVLIIENQDSNSLKKNEEICTDGEKLHPIIDSIHQESQSNNENLIELNDYDVNSDIVSIINNLVQSVIDKEMVGKNENINENNIKIIDEKSNDGLSKDLYFPFNKFNNKEVIEQKRELTDTIKNEHELRGSIESKVGVEEKDEDLLKTCESTEESSSTDSNSHLMSYIYPSIENESMDQKVHDIDRVLSPDKDVDIGNDNHSVSEQSNVLQDGSQLDAKVDTPQEQANKESILNALGLTSLKTVVEDKPKRDSYTGTLKAVIKLNRNTDKKSGGLKMIFKQAEEESSISGDRLEYRICSEPETSTEGVPLTHLADIASLKKPQGGKPARSQFDLSSSPNIVGAQTSSQESSSSSDSKDGAGAKESNLVIPEKSSSFSIHPGRLCSDVCSYCFGKFGSLDTPCHLAQLKNAERLNKILTTETHLSVDSCLCDGCFRYVDRRSNCPSSKSLARKPGQRRGPLSGTSCSVQGCTQAARHSVRRKWLIKLKKSISKKLVIDMDKNPHLPFPLCSQHYYWVDYFTVCGICKKRLTRNHMYALGSEIEELNVVLCEDGIPVKLSDKLFLCKLCRYYSSLRLKYKDISQMTTNHKSFFEGYRKKILMYHDVPITDSDEDRKSTQEEDTKSTELKPRKKKTKSKSTDSLDGKKRSGDKSTDEKTENECDKLTDPQMIDYSYLESLGMRHEIPENYEGENCVGFNNIASLLNPLESGKGTVYPSDTSTRSRVDMKPTRIQVKFGNLNIGKLSNLNIGQDNRPGSDSRCTATNASRPPFLPGERDLQLIGELDFHGLPTSNANWEKCTSIIQFDSDTKKLWQELQRPYGNQSSFLRHLLILEKHWRAGSLVYSEKPDPRAVKYITSVQNRVQAYEGGGANSSKPNIPPPPPAIPLVSASVKPPPVSTPSSLPSSTPPPLLKIPQSYSIQDQTRMNTNYSMATTQVFGPVGLQRFPGLSKTSATVGPRPRKPNIQNVAVGRGLNIRTPGAITFQQFKRLQIQKAINQMENKSAKNSEAATSHQLTTNPPPIKTFVPLISDVRSLATTSSQQTRQYQHILPKIPKALTVTQIVQPNSSPVLLPNTSLTIEKATNPSSKPVAVLCPEKPSISVFREPTINGNV